MAKETKELTTKQKKSKYSRLKWVCRISEIAVIPVPVGVLAIVNRATWFPNADVGCRVGIGGAIAMALLMYVATLVTKQKEKDSKITDGYFTVLCSCALLTAIALLVREIANQIAYIMCIEMSGVGAGFGLDLTKKYFIKKENEQAEILKNAELKLATEKALNELESETQEKKVKIKIKK